MHCNLSHLVPLLPPSLLPSLRYEKAAYSSFLVFVGVAMSITAFPVLARILTESKLILSTAGEPLPPSPSPYLVF